MALGTWLGRRRTGTSRRPALRALGSLPRREPSDARRRDLDPCAHRRRRYGLRRSPRPERGALHRLEPPRETSAVHPLSRRGTWQRVGGRPATFDWADDGLARCVARAALIAQ